MFKFKSEKKALKGNYCIIEVGSLTIDDELLMLHDMDRHGYILVEIVINKYIFRRKGLL
jgi:hypothetical protein